MNQSAGLSGPAWAVVPGLRLRRWGDELAVYDGLSAQTHVLRHLSADLLDLLQSSRGALTLNELSWRLFADDGDPAGDLDADERAELERLLEALVALELVQRAS